MRFVPPSMAGHFAVHGKNEPAAQGSTPASRLGSIVNPPRSVRPKQRIRLVTRTSARMSIYRPQVGAVLAWELCKTP
jgi:hypothetical protein